MFDQMHEKMQSMMRNSVKEPELMGPFSQEVHTL